MNVRAVDTNFHVTGQISASEFQPIAKAGYKTVICMRPDGEGFNQPKFADIAEAAKSAGLEAFYIPVTPGAMTVDQAKSLKKIISEKEGPVLAYCASGNRCVGAYEMAKRV